MASSKIKFLLPVTCNSLFVFTIVKPNKNFT